MNRTYAESLQSKLRELIESDRLSMVKYYEGHIEDRTRHFLLIRQPNKTIYEVYGDYQPVGIREVTNYDEAYEKMGVARYRQQANRPPFEVTFRDNANEIIRALAEGQVEEMILTFLARAMEKLGPVVERKGSVQIERKARGGFRRGAWVGTIQFDFDDGTHFIGELQVITNFTKFGRPYGQYPMRFYDAILDPTNPDAILSKASIEEIWASVNYVPPPPEKRKRWAKIVGGSVVLHDGKPVFINTPGQVKKLGIPADAEQIARIEAGSKYGHIEYANGTTAHFEYPPELLAEHANLERNYKFNQAASLLRQRTFEHFYPQKG